MIIFSQIKKVILIVVIVMLSACELDFNFIEFTSKVNLSVPMAE